MGLYEASNGNPERALVLLQQQASKERLKKKMYYGFLKFNKRYMNMARKTGIGSLYDKAYFYKDLANMIERLK